MEMEDNESLSDILAGSSAFSEGKPAEKVAEKPAPVVTEAPKDDEPKSEATTSEPTKDEPKQDTKADGLLAATLEERRKRQVAEAEAKQLREQLGKASKTSVFDNEDKAINERMAEVVNPLTDKLFRLEIQLKKQERPDFDEVVKHFVTAAAANPTLQHQMDSAESPLDFAYSEGLRLRELSEVGGDFAKYKAKVTAAKDQEIAALKAQLAEVQRVQEDLSNLPRNHNGVSSGTSPNVANVDDEDITKIVRFGNK